jgi:hypothetical protein
LNGDPPTIDFLRVMSVMPVRPSANQNTNIYGAHNMMQFLKCAPAHTKYLHIRLLSMVEGAKASVLYVKYRLLLDMYIQEVKLFTWRSPSWLITPNPYDEQSS